MRNSFPGSNEEVLKGATCALPFGYQTIDPMAWKEFQVSQESMGVVEWRVMGLKPWCQDGPGLFSNVSLLLSI